MPEKTPEGEALKNILNYLDEGVVTPSEVVEPGCLYEQVQSTVFDYENGKPKGSA